MLSMLVNSYSALKLPIRNSSVLYNVVMANVLANIRSPADTEAYSGFLTENSRLLQLETGLMRADQKKPQNNEQKDAETLRRAERNCRVGNVSPWVRHTLHVVIWSFVWKYWLVQL